jgi:hypothetical protein
MTLNELLTVVAQVAGLLGITGSMFNINLNLTVPQIITPLKNVRLVVRPCWRTSCWCPCSLT